MIRAASLRTLEGTSRRFKRVYKGAVCPPIKPTETQRSSTPTSSFFAYLPITLIGFFVIGRYGGHKAAVDWLVASSLFNYAWWNPIYLVVLLSLVVSNYVFGGQLHRGSSHQRLLLILGVAVKPGGAGLLQVLQLHGGQCESRAELELPS